jgi:hypothetical protein
MMEKFISQGTISVLIGCHSPIHSYYVTKAWRHLYGKWPEPWEVVCIFLHDLGHWGKNYFEDIELKRQHWKAGARIAGYLFGRKGYKLTAGHCPSSDVPRSLLYMADKTSWVLAPMWWHYLYCLFEPQITKGASVSEHIPRFKEWVNENIARENPRETHAAVEELANERAKARG